MLLKGIYRTNIRKHGLFRATLGGFIMYPSIVVFIIFEVIFLKKITDILLIFNNNVQVLNKKDYITYGRIDLENYNWFDRFNCHFCAYANGVTHILSAAMDLVGDCRMDTLDEVQKKKVDGILAITFMMARPFGVITYIIFVSAFSKLLSYDKPDKNVIKDILKKINYAQGLRSDRFKSVYLNAFKLRLMFKAFEHTLSIIESNWCPLTYANKEELMKHQEKFISTGPEDAAEFILRGNKK